MTVQLSKQRLRTLEGASTTSRAPMVLEYIGLYRPAHSQWVKCLLGYSDWQTRFVLIQHTQPVGEAIARI